MPKFKIIKSEEALEPRPTFQIYYGPAGVGKTSFGFTFGKTLHFDFDEGVSRAVQKIRPDSIKVDLGGYGDLWKWVESPDFERYVTENEYEVLSLDTIGTMLDNFVTPWIISANPKNGNYSGGLSLPGWGVLGTHFKNFLIRIRSLGLELIAICHSKEKDEKYVLDVKGGSAQVIYRAADVIGFMYMINERERTVDFNPVNRDGKNMVGWDPFQIPNAESDEYDLFGQSITAAIKKKMVEASAAQVGFKKELEEWREGLEQCNDEKSFDEMIAKITEVENKTLKAAVKRILGKQLKTNGFVYDKEAKAVLKADPVEEKEAVENED